MSTRVTKLQGMGETSGSQSPRNLIRVGVKWGGGRQCCQPARRGRAFHTEDSINRDQRHIRDTVWEDELNARDRC